MIIREFSRHLVKRVDILFPGLQLHIVPFQADKKYKCDAASLESSLAMKVYLYEE
jgi:hypothetical protein